VEEVLVWNEDDDMATRVRTKGEDSGYGSLSSREGAVMAGAESPFDARAVCEGEEGGNEVVRVRDGINVDGVMIRGGLICKCDDGLGSGWVRRKVKGTVDAGVGPCETGGDAESWEGGREKRGEGSGDWGGGNVEGGRVIRGEGAQEGSRREFGEVNGEGLSVLCDGEFDGQDGKHVVKRFDRGGVEGSANFSNSDVLCYL